MSGTSSHLEDMPPGGWLSCGMKLIRSTLSVPDNPWILLLERIRSGRGQMPGKVRKCNHATAVDLGQPSMPTAVEWTACPQLPMRSLKVCGAGKALLPYNEGDPSWWESQTNLLGRIHDAGPMYEFNRKVCGTSSPHPPAYRPGTWGKAHAQ